MGTGEQLLRAVCEAPDDDTPRLVCADWLDDHGDPARAEFIRLDVALSNALRRDGPGGLMPTMTRLIALRDAHHARWRDELPGGPEVRYGAFRRGFPDTMTVDSLAEFPLDLLPLVFDEVPIRSLTLCGPIPYPELVALRLPWGRLKYLELCFPGWTDDEWLRLPDTPVAAAEFLDVVTLPDGGDLPDPVQDQLDRRFGERIGFRVQD